MSRAPADPDDVRWWADTGARELGELLYWRWDPIGVAAEFPASIGEYDAYVPPVRAALDRSAPDGAVDAVAVCLATIEADAMGLDPVDDARVRETARTIVAWRERSREAWWRRS